MEKKIYEGRNVGLLTTLDGAVEVYRNTEPGSTVEGREVTILHLRGVTVKKAEYWDPFHVVEVGGLNSARKNYDHLEKAMRMSITLYGVDERSLGGVERKILDEIKGKGASSYERNK
ncbi:hypothetical protein HYX14_02180 [Candidatus Woesearchaeota archaeon]|nr:hypothetical protein [Candidatus Woesearchaeota archaeon]